MDSLDADAVHCWTAAAARALLGHQGEINELNVYPIPDRDTGTNMAMTMRAAADAGSGTGKRAEPGDAETVVAALVRVADAAVLGARGNSGVILAQLLRGLADSMVSADSAASDVVAAPIGPMELAIGLSHAVSCAYAAVGEPVEGTILSVARAAAQSAGRAVEAVGAGLSEVAHAALDGATDALARTPDQLDELRAAGVVDAGGRGLVVVLDALVRTIDGQPVDEQPINQQPLGEDCDRTEPAQPVGPGPEGAPGPPGPPGARDTHGPGSTESFAYEVQYLLEAEEHAVGLLRGHLSDLGDSIAVVGTGSGQWNVHVHVDDVGAAIEAGIRAGRPYRIEVTRFADQHVAPQPVRRPGVAIVAIAPGRGLGEVFRREGVHVVESTGVGAASPEDIFAAVLATGAGAVVLLPNAEAVGGVAELAAARARDHGISVAVVPTRSPVQGLAAVAVHDPSRRFEDDVIHMAESAAEHAMGRSHGGRAAKP